MIPDGWTGERRASLSVALAPALVLDFPKLSSEDEHEHEREEPREQPVLMAHFEAPHAALARLDPHVQRLTPAHELIGSPLQMSLTIIGFRAALGCVVVCAVATAGSLRAAAAPQYADGRPEAKLRMEAKDQGVVLKHGPDECDARGARDIWV